jgi:site-specific DNA recombinase
MPRQKNASLKKLLPIANSYSLRGIRLKGPLTKEGLRRILTNSLYYGPFKWNGVLYQGKHEPIITKMLFDRVQAILHNGDRQRPVRNLFVFKGLLQCKECGCLITAEKHVKKSGISFIYYHCTHTKYANEQKPARCSTGYWTEPKLTDLFGQAILRPLSFPAEILNYCRALLSETQLEDKEFATNRMADLQRKLTGLKKFQSVAYEDKIRGDISEEDWKEKYNNWKNLEIAYKTEIEKLEARKTDWNEQTFKILELTQDIETLYITLPLDKKAELLKIVSSNSELDAVTLYPKYKRPFDLLAKRPFVSEWRSGRGSNSRPPA